MGHGTDGILNVERKVTGLFGFSIDKTTFIINFSTERSLVSSRRSDFRFQISDFNQCRQSFMSFGLKLVVDLVEQVSIVSMIHMEYLILIGLKSPEMKGS